MRRQRTSIWFLAVVALGACGCMPLRPRPVPSLLPPSVQPPSVLPSSIHLPIKRPAPDVAGYESELCRFAKGHGVYGVEAAYIDANYEVWRRDVNLRLSHDSFLASTYAYFWLDGTAFILGIPIPGQCGWDDEEARQVEVNSVSKLSWAPEWFLKTTTTARLDPKNRCKVTFRDIDLTERVVGLGQRLLDRASQRFDEEIRKRSNFRPQAEQFWKKLQEPVPLSADVSLLVQPKTVKAGPIDLTPDTPPQILSTSVDLTAEPRVVFGPPPQLPVTPLPELGAAPDVPAGFNVWLEASLPFAEANAMIKDPKNGVVGKTYRYGRRELIISDAHMYGTQEKMVLRLTVEGYAIPGTYPPIEDAASLFINIAGHIRDCVAEDMYDLDAIIYLTGTPTLNAADRTIVFPDLTYDLQTQNLIAKAANWILKSRLEERLRLETKLPFGQKIDEERERLNRAINRPLGDDASISGSVDLKLTDAYVWTDRLKSRFQATGRAELRVGWK